MCILNYGIENYYTLFFIMVCGDFGNKSLNVLEKPVSKTNKSDGRLSFVPRIVEERAWCTKEKTCSICNCNQKVSGRLILDLLH